MLEPFAPTFFRSLQQLKIRTRKAVLGSRQGSHRSIRRGHGLEFSDFRPYSAGDDFRQIDWNVYGRTDRLYVREYREERDLNVVLLIDTSASMGYPVGENKFEFARRLALALGYIGLADGDSVMFGLLGQRVTPRYIGPRALARAWKELDAISAEGSFSIQNECRAALASTRLPGKCFFISDFLAPSAELFPALDYIRSRNFDLSLLQVLAPAEFQLQPSSSVTEFVDSETGEILSLGLDQGSSLEYAKVLSNHIAELEQYCVGAGLKHILLSSADDLAEVVLTRLPELKLLQ